VDEIKIQAEVHPTEDVAKVQQAIENIFPGVNFKEIKREKKKFLVASGEDLSVLAKFAYLMKREKIRDASRKALYHGVTGNTITFFLNKQVAFAEHISFCEPFGESPLGPIKVQILTETPRKIIEQLTPRSR
jgi:predicted RNA binding protein with dsRBD fold (UPF0201 family)